MLPDEKENKNSPPYGCERGNHSRHEKLRVGLKMKVKQGKHQQGANETAEVSPSDIMFMADGRFLFLRFIGRKVEPVPVTQEGVRSVMDYFTIPEKLYKRLSTETRSEILNDLLESETAPVTITARKEGIIRFSNSG